MNVAFHIISSAFVCFYEIYMQPWLMLFCLVDENYK